VFQFRFCTWATDIRELIQRKRGELEQPGIIRTARIIHSGAAVRHVTASYSNFAYSALAAFRMGMSGSTSFQRVRKSLSGAKRAWDGPCAVLHSIEHTLNETVLRNQCCLLYAEEVDPCGLFQDIRTN
jgi:hypothetical protein